MRSVSRARILLGAVVVAAGLAACGSNGTLLTPGAATQLTADLTQASSALSQYNCEVATAALNNFRSSVADLQGVNQTLLSMLSQGASTVTALADQRCPGSGTASSTTTTGTDTTTTATTTTTAATTTSTAAITTVTETDTNTNTTGGAPATTVTTGPVTDTGTGSTPAQSTTVNSGGGSLSGDSGDSGGGAGQ